MPLIALQVTTSVGLVAGVTVVLTLAWPLFGLPAGMIVDRVDRRRLVGAVNLMRALALGGLTATVVTGTASIGWVYAAALLLGLGETLVDTSLAALIPQLVRRPQSLGRANARLEVAQNVMNQFLGPPLGGLLAAVGLAAVTGTGAVLFVLTVPAVMRGRYRADSLAAPVVPAPAASHAVASAASAPASPAESTAIDGGAEHRLWRTKLTAGIRFIWCSPLLRGLTLITAAMNVFWAAWLAVLVVYVVAPGPVDLTPAGYGLLLTAMAAGGVAGAAVVTPLRRRLGAYRLLALDVVGTILLIGTPALTTNPIAIGAGMAVGGAGSAVWRVIVDVVGQAVTPAELLGRVYSASRVISWGVLPIGAALGGLVAEVSGLRMVFVIGGLASVGLLLAYALAIRPSELAAALPRWQVRQPGRFRGVWRVGGGGHLPTHRTSRVRSPLLTERARSVHADRPRHRIPFMDVPLGRSVGMAAALGFDRIGRAAFRSLILSSTRSPRLKAMVARHGLRAGADRFVAGESLAECLPVLDQLHREGMRTYVIALGEAVYTTEGAEAAAALYETLIPEVDRRGTGTTFSIKLTHLGLELDPELALRNARRVVGLAAAHSAFVRLDMEHSGVVDDTLAIYRKLRADGLDNTGVVLQAYLHRSLDDLTSLLPLGPNVRVVKGAYLEPPAVALQRKARVDRAYLRLLQMALSHAPFTAVATHDPVAIRSAIATARAEGSSFEFQMLYGIRYGLARELVANGHSVRICVPFGDDWFVYFARRLAERPANVFFLLRSLAGR